MKHTIETIETPGAIFVTESGLRILVDTRDHESASKVAAGDSVVLTQDRDGMSDEYLLSVEGSDDRIRCGLAESRRR